MVRAFSPGSQDSPIESIVLVKVRQARLVGAALGAVPTRTQTGIRDDRPPRVILQQERQQIIEQMFTRGR